MTLASGTKLGPYEVLGAAGAGGMGEVYRTRHAGWNARWRSRSSRVVPFRGPGAKRQISSDGASAPDWIGARIAYISAERKLILVDAIERAEGLDIGNPSSAFGGKPLPAMPRAPNSVAAPIYITHDGKRVLLPVPADDNPAMNLTLVSNWTAELKK